MEFDPEFENHPDEYMSRDATPAPAAANTNAEPQGANQTEQGSSNGGRNQCKGLTGQQKIVAESWLVRHRVQIEEENVGRKEDLECPGLKNVS